MKKRSFFVVLFALSLVASVALAQGNGNGRGRGRGKHGDDDEHGPQEIAQRSDVAFSVHDRNLIREWFRVNRSNLPPGLAKRDRLPPGLQKQLVERGTLPPGLEKRMVPLPIELERQLPPPPPDCRRVIIGGSVVLFNVRTSFISGVVQIAIP